VDPYYRLSATFFCFRSMRAREEIDGQRHAAYGRTPSEVKAYAACRQTARASAAPQFYAMVANAQTGGKVASDRTIAAPAE
jgi:hypothetical protein